MKKLITFLTSLTLLLCCAAAFAESEPAAKGTTITGQIVEGSYVIPFLWGGLALAGTGGLAVILRKNVYELHCGAEKRKWGRRKR